MAWPTNATIPKTATQGASWQPGDMDNAQYQFCRDTGILASDVDPTTVKAPSGLYRGYFVQATPSSYGTTPVSTGTTYDLINGEPDQVANITVPADSLVRVWYFAQYKLNWTGTITGGSAWYANLFVNSSAVQCPATGGGTTNALAQLSPSSGMTAPVYGNVSTGNSGVGAGGFTGALETWTGGISTVEGAGPGTAPHVISHSANSSFPSVSTPTTIFGLAAGTYTFSVKWFAPSTGSISRRYARMYVEVLGF